MEAFEMERDSWLTSKQKKQLRDIVAGTVIEQEKRKAADENAKLAKEFALKEQTLKRKAAEDVRAKEDIISYLIPPKSAKNDYMEQKQAKYVFKCMDGDIQIPEYGIFRTDFYYKERIDYLE